MKSKKRGKKRLSESEEQTKSTPKSSKVQDEPQLPNWDMLLHVHIDSPSCEESVKKLREDFKTVMVKQETIDFAEIVPEEKGKTQVFEQTVQTSLIPRTPGFHQLCDVAQCSNESLQNLTHYLDKKSKKYVATAVKQENDSDLPLAFLNQDQLKTAGSVVPTTDAEIFEAYTRQKDTMQKDMGQRDEVFFSKSTATLNGRKKNQPKKILEQGCSHEIKVALQKKLRQRKRKKNVFHKRNTPSSSYAVMEPPGANSIPPPSGVNNTGLMKIDTFKDRL